MFVTVYSSIACTPAVKVYILSFSNTEGQLPTARCLGMLLDHSDVGEWYRAEY